VSYHYKNQIKGVGLLQGHHISGVIVSMIALNGVDHGFKTELRSKSKDWLAQNQNNVSEWVNMWTVISVS
jgi:hypothetical protein